LLFQWKFQYIEKNFHARKEINKNTNDMFQAIEENKTIFVLMF